MDEVSYLKKQKVCLKNNQKLICCEIMESFARALNKSENCQKNIKSAWLKKKMFKVRKNVKILSASAIRKGTFTK